MTTFKRFSPTGTRRLYVRWCRPIVVNVCGVCAFEWRWFVRAKWTVATGWVRLGLVEV